MSSERLFEDPDVDLADELCFLYDWDFMKARNLARVKSYADFRREFSLLESVVGKGTAEFVVANGEFVKYGIEAQKQYIKLAARAYAKLEGELEVNQEHFVSVESLKGLITRKPSPRYEF